MTNNIVALDFLGVKVILDVNTKILKLAAPQAATVETLDSLADGTAYQVPTGKKATIINIALASGMDAVTDEVIRADDEDGVVNKVILSVAPNDLGADALFLSAEVPADKFINKNSAAAGDTLDLWIIEEDA